MTLMIRDELGLAGYYRLQVVRDGKVRTDTGWFKNLITDQGLNFIGAINPPIFSTTNQLNTHVAVGTGTTPPAFTDTGLASQLAMLPATGSGAAGTTALSYTAGPPPYWACVWTYQFPLGAVVGNISEVGVGNTISTDVACRVFSRCLILDSFGNPTIISVTALDILIITYELRYYINTNDVAYSIVIDGTFGPVTYSGTARRMLIGTIPQIMYPVPNSGSGAMGNVFLTAYGGFLLGPVTGQPSYTQNQGGSSFVRNFVPYIGGTYYIEFSATMPLTTANFTSGINGLSVGGNHGSYQFSVSPNIPKTNAFQLTIVWRTYWSRYP